MHLLFHVIPTHLQISSYLRTDLVSRDLGILSTLKKENRNECKNYQGISLIDTPQKIYTRIVCTRMQVISEMLLPEGQILHRQHVYYKTSDRKEMRFQQWDMRDFNSETCVALIKSLPPCKLPIPYRNVLGRSCML